MSGKNIRPTADRVRESIFNILPHDLADLSVLDLYAGAGAMGLEALSRHAKAAVFVDSAHEAIKLMRDNVDTIGLRDQARLMHKKAGAALKLLSAEGRAFDLVFLDPPYASGEADKALALIAALGLLNPRAVVVAEHAAGRELAPGYGPLTRFDHRVYGDTAVSFYRVPDPPEPEADP